MSSSEATIVHGDQYQESSDARTDRKLSIARQHPDYDESRRMLATEWRGAKNMEVRERGMPMLTEPGDAIVRITTAAICGSDLHMYFDELPGKEPMKTADVMGHEGVGVVEAIGADVKHVKVGDRVTISAVIACGHCRYCKKEQFSFCNNTNPSKEMEQTYGRRLAGVFGYSHLTGAYEGTQAEVCRVPLADVNLLVLPASVSDNKAVFLSDVFCTAWHANELAEVGKGDSVVVWGAGPIGLGAAYLAAKVREARRVVIIDDCQYRLDLAQRSIPRIETLNFAQLDVVKHLQQTFPDGVDRCIDATGFRYAKGILHRVERALKLESDTPEVITQAVSVCRKGGNLCTIADYFGTANHFPIGHIMELGITLRGSQLWCQKYWKTLLPLIENGTIDPTFMVTHVIPLEHAGRGYDTFANKQDGCVKVLLKTKASPEYASVLANAQRYESSEAKTTTPTAKAN